MNKGDTIYCYESVGEGFRLVRGTLLLEPVPNDRYVAVQVNGVTFASLSDGWATTQKEALVLYIESLQAYSESITAQIQGDLYQLARLEGWMDEAIKNLKEIECQENIDSSSSPTRVCPSH